MNCFLGRKVKTAPEGIELLCKGIAARAEFSQLYHSEFLFSFYLSLRLERRNVRRRGKHNAASMMAASPGSHGCA